MNNIIANLQNFNTWKRGFMILIFVVGLYVGIYVLLALVLIQFGSKLITGNPIKNLFTFGQDLSKFLYEIARYLCFVREEMPYPFSTKMPEDTEPSEAAALLSGPTTEAQ